jgi:hypothetical protein
LQEFFFFTIKKKEYGKEFLILANFLEGFPRIPGTEISKKRNPKKE